MSVRIPFYIEIDINECVYSRQRKAHCCNILVASYLYWHSLALPGKLYTSLRLTPLPAGVIILPPETMLDTTQRESLCAAALLPGTGINDFVHASDPQAVLRLTWQAMHRRKDNFKALELVVAGQRRVVF